MVSPQRRMAIEREAERGGDAKQVLDPPTVTTEAVDDEVYCENDRPDRIRDESEMYNVANR